MRHAVILVGLVFCARADIPAQALSAAAASFEAASVKPNTSGERNTSVRRLPGGRFTATNVPVAFLVQLAHQLQPFQMQGAPDWLRSDRFDVVAKMEGDPAPPPVGSSEPDQMTLALQALLADRFKLVAHWETQELPIYALVLARADRTLGPNIRPAAVDCTAAAAASATGRPRRSSQVPTGVRRLRPTRRRFFKIARPLLVEFRLRNPCWRLRRIFDG